VKNYKTFIFDIDGTIVKQDEAMPGAIKLLCYLMMEKKKVLFVTDNPSTTKKILSEKLKNIGFPIIPEQIITPIDSSDLFLQEKEMQKSEIILYPLIKDVVLNKFETRQIRFINNEEDLCSHVLLGMNDKLQYDHFSKALNYLDNGGELILLNGDLLYPVTSGRIPDSEALCSVHPIYTGKEATTVGKPTNWMQKPLLNRINSSIQDCLLVGDSHLSDIQFGHKMGMDTCLVQTEITSYLNGTETENIVPDYTLKDCNALYDLIQERERMQLNYV